MEPIPPSSRKLADSAKVVASRAWTGAKEAALATSSHALRVKDYGQKRWQLQRLAREALTARVRLGQKLVEIGRGDAAKLTQIKTLQERILSLQAAGTSAKPVQAEQRAMLAALGAWAVEAGESIPGADTECQAAMAAQQAWLEQQHGVTQAQAALRPGDRQQTVRIGLGYAAISLALVATVWAWGPLGSSPSPVIAPPIGVPPAPGEPVADGGFTPGVPEPETPSPVLTPTPSPTPVFTPAPTTQACANCYGTGQSNCTACFGSGKKTCFACNGMGSQPNPANNFLRLQCFQCNGTGKQNCSFCQYGKVQCPYCFGSGRTRG